MLDLKKVAFVIILSLSISNFQIHGQRVSALLMGEVDATSDLTLGWRIALDGYLG
ncbi:hypothetical protein [Acidithrix ferrooxidans]|uniref:Uncharacterized protein n=1 Tax=Acidithrix ferrooxidans TaxID=1280514 RepID=A0A0D8HGR4_9ACTN|nr:hypothetical protein [Acidithrix ferrooxidans]KJF17113.1 hypothetical protein AXFE_20260 [Acidithrix ferrooxidans]